MTNWLWTFELRWRPAVVLATGVLLLGLLLRRRRVRFASALATEAAVVLYLYALWQVAGSLSVSQVSGALSRGQWLWDAERWLRLPSEKWLQDVIIDHQLVVKAANAYYALLHAPPLAVFLLWLFIWHRDRYAHVRNVVVLLTAMCLLIQLIPVAPPRLIPGLHMVDTARLYGQSVYGDIGTGISDQLSAMPSVHIGWATLIGIGVVRIGRSPWRWLVLVHPIVMNLVVVVTANHFWLDGAVAVVLLGLAEVLAGLGERAAPRIRRRLGSVAGAVPWTGRTLPRRRQERRRSVANPQP